MHKFEKLEVWKLALDYIDQCYAIAAELPKAEAFNLAEQLRRASVSIALNIAEGSTGQSNPEQARFLGMAIRSLMETVACQHLIFRRKYRADAEPLRAAYRASETLAAKLQAMRSSVAESYSVREESTEWLVEGTPFDE